jgi:thiamine biosynthesis lipoprotein
MPDSRPACDIAERSARRIRVEHVMGTTVSVDLRDAGVPENAFAELFAWLHDVDARFSTYRADSEISRLGCGRLMLAEVSDDVREVLAMCEQVTRESGGAFNVWRHRSDGVLDPSALVKGWSVERGAAILQAAGGRNFCINAGGDVITRGAPEPGRGWRVGVRHPEQPDRVAAVVAASNLAVATSAAYERGEHLVDPRSGEPATQLLSMTVAGPSLTFADAYATAAFVLGVEGARWVAGLPGYAAYAVTAAGRAVWTDAFQPLLVRG